MTNAINYKDQNFQKAAVAVMNDILNSDVNGSNMDDVYDTVCKYVKITKEQFKDFFDQAENKISQWKADGVFEKEARELEEDELDMVVGGGLGSFFSAVGSCLSKAASAVGNFVKEHAVAIGTVVGAALLCTGIGAVVGVAAGCLVSLATGTALGATVAATTAACTVMAGTWAGIAGTALVAYECATGAISDSLNG